MLAVKKTKCEDDVTGSEDRAKMRPWEKEWRGLFEELHLFLGQQPPLTQADVLPDRS